MISGNYRELRPDEVDAVAARLADAWQDDRLPERQYDMVVRAELEAMRQGQLIAPFQTLIETLRKLPFSDPVLPARVLDVGAASGYYGEVLERAGFGFHYTAFDRSSAFRTLARTLYPDIHFDLGDARLLPYHDGWFDIVLSSACIMHVPEYVAVLHELARVAGRWVVLHRTPVSLERPTTYYQKDAYGIPCLEIHFNENVLLDLCEGVGLHYRDHADVTWDDETGSGYRTYVFDTPDALMHHPV